MPTAPVASILVMTDVVDSTQLASSLGDVAMAKRWIEHDRYARALMDELDGLEVDRTDGFFLVFRDAVAAVAFAGGYHAILERIDMRARIGIHGMSSAWTGQKHSPELLEAKQQTEWVMTLARGGQTLVTQRVQGSGEGGLPALLSCGHWRFHGATETMELYQAPVGEVPGPPPSDGDVAHRVVKQGNHWIPAKGVEHRLPAEVDAFVGREPELRRLAQLVHRPVRLVNILGAGGTGKTRLVIHFAWLWLGDFPGGVWFCDLADAQGIAGIASSVARSLNVALGKLDPIEQLGYALRGRGRCLLILDNFEQLAEFGEATIDEWLDRARSLQIVVTSRTKLGLAGEVVLPLDPLDTEDAIALFAARATQVQPDLALDSTQRTAVSKLVRLLDGLPLTIELAGSRVGELSVEQLLEQIQARMAGAAQGGAANRQSRLQAALDWSWNLLDADEQTALAQLSVFEGGFTLESAEEVLALADLWAGDALEALLDKSWIRADGAGRLSLMGSVQEYARAQLDDDGEARSRHGRWFAQMGSSSALEALSVRGGVERRMALADEVENLVAACRRAVVRGDGMVAVQTLDALVHVYLLQGPFRAIGSLAQQVHDGLELAPPLRLRTLRMLAQGHAVVGERAGANARFEEALMLAKSLEDRRSEAYLLALQGRACVGWRQFAWAEEPLNRALALFREIGDRRGEAVTRGHLGVLRDTSGKMTDAVPHYEAYVAYCREVGDRRGEGSGLSNLGMAYLDLGRFASADALLAQGLDIHRQVGNRFGQANVLTAHAHIYATDGRVARGLEVYEEAVELHRALGNRMAHASVVANLGVLWSEIGDLETARTYCLEGLALHEETVNRYSQCNVLGMLARIERWSGNVEAAVTYATRGIQVAREAALPDRAALLTVHLAQAHLAAGRRSQAVANAQDGLERYQALGNDMGSHRAHAVLAQAGQPIEIGVLEAASQSAEVSRRRLLWLAVHLGLAHRHAALGAHFEVASTLSRAAAGIPEPYRQLHVEIAHTRLRLQPDQGPTGDTMGG